MKILLLTTVLWSAFAGGDRERGMQLYKAGKFAEAQTAFAAAAKDDPESAELQWNLALAAWRAGDLDTAEVAAEKYAALSEDIKEELHRGMLGAIRLAQSAEWEAKADAALAAQQQGMAGPPEPDKEPPQPLRMLKTALRKAASAKQHFVRGVRANPTPELLRNTERTLRKIAELKKRIEELEKQQQQEQKEGDKNPDDKKPEDKGDEQDPNKSDEQKGDQKESENQQNKDEQKGDEKKPDDKQGEQQKDDQKKSDPKQDEQQKDNKSDPKEGEGAEPPESPEPQPNEPKPNESENPEPKPSPEEGKNGESDPNEAEKPENAEPGAEQKQAKEGQPPPPPEPKPGEQRTDAPGEGGKGLELTPEQAQRLLERAKKLDEQLKQAKARRTTRRRAVERDW